VLVRETTKAFLDLDLPPIQGVPMSRGKLGMPWRRRVPSWSACRRRMLSMLDPGTRRHLLRRCLDARNGPRAILFFFLFCVFFNIKTLGASNTLLYS
jgi:hypothetical protein